MKHFLNICLLAFAGIPGLVYANSMHYYQDFWSPRYHSERLAYCKAGNKVCGEAVAREYCKQLGFQAVTHHIIEYNVGLTHYLSTKAACQGWECHGFKLIRCVGKLEHSPKPIYYYRKRRFDFPRFGHYRVDWCYENDKGCGAKAARSFCRRMGYLRHIEYAKDTNIAATKAIGNQRLCFGQECESFRYITCYR